MTNQGYSQSQNSGQLQIFSGQTLPAPEKTFPQIYGCDMYISTPPYAMGNRIFTQNVDTLFKTMTSGDDRETSPRTRTRVFTNVHW